jgi:hypothetical protein
VSEGPLSDMVSLATPVALAEELPVLGSGSVDDCGIIDVGHITVDSADARSELVVPCKEACAESADDWGAHSEVVAV